MKLSTVETWIWVLIYGGLVVLVFGLALHGREAAIGKAMVVAGGIVAAVGAALVWVRSRMRDGDGR